MSEPMTEAGRALLDDYPARYGGALYTDPVSRELTIAAILEIEVEAARAANERAERLVEGVSRLLVEYDRTLLTHDVAYEDVSEAIDALRAALRDTATTPAPQAEGLDVERLEEAIFRAGWSQGDAFVDAEMAAAIARAYADAGRDIADAATAALQTFAPETGRKPR